MSIMSKYTEKTLDKLLKKDLISIVLSQQPKMDVASSEIIDQIGKFGGTWRKKIFQKVGCPIEGNNIETFHRTSKKNERIIVKF